MGIIIGSKTVNLEKRYSGFEVLRDMTGDKAHQIRIHLETGYYDDNGEWRNTKSEYRYLQDDVARYILSRSPSDLSLADPGIGAMLKGALYGMEDGSIPMTATLNVTAQDGASNPIAATIEVTKNDGGAVVATGPTGTPLVIDTVYLDVTITVSADGYTPFTQNVATLAGTFTQTVTLTPA